MTMPVATPSIIDTRRHQMFPILEASEIERVRRFGEIRCYGAGEALVKAGDAGHGHYSCCRRAPALSLRSQSFNRAGFE